MVNGWLMRDSLRWGLGRIAPRCMGSPQAPRMKGGPVPHLAYTRRGVWAGPTCGYRKTTSGLADMRRSVTLIAGMIDLLKLLAGLLVGVFRSHAAREAEMALLRLQLVVLQRSALARLRLRTADRLIFVWLYRLFPSVLEAAVVFKPETLVRWHRSGFRLYWRWKARRHVGRLVVPADLLLHRRVRKTAVAALGVVFRTKTRIVIGADRFSDPGPRCTPAMRNAD
jgi:hypothetical protein